MSRQNIHFYIDDTGTKEPEATGTRYFAYGGIAVRESNEDFVRGRVSSLTKQYFPEVVELKSRWFRFPELRKTHYLSPFGLSKEQFDLFSKELFDLFCRLPIRCLGVVVDKTRQRDHYSLRQFSPSAVSYDLLMQRIANFCTQYGGESVEVFVDDISGKNPKGKKWKDLLVRQHDLLLRGRSPFYKNWTTRSGMNYSQFKHTPIFLNSEQSIFVQLADLCAYNVMRQGKDYWGNFDDEPFYRGYRWIKPFMHRDPESGRIDHFGALCFPE